MFDFIKRMFQGEPESTVVVQNDTRHTNPQYNQLPGDLFKKEFKSTKDAILLDVRTASEFNSGALPGAVNIDIMSSKFQSTVAALDKSKTYYIYCRSGNRSGQACQLMSKMGFDVRNLMGGIGAWPR